MNINIFMNFLNHISRILCEKKSWEETHIKDKDSFQMISISEDCDGVEHCGWGEKMYGEDAQF